MTIGGVKSQLWTATANKKSSSRGIASYRCFQRGIANRTVRAEHTKEGSRITAEASRLSNPSRNDQSWLRSWSGLAVCVLITVGRSNPGCIRITVVIG